MPPLPGFSDNSLKTRDQIVQAGEALIQPLAPYASSGCSRVRIPVNSGTLYDATAAELEGFARPLFVAASMIMGGDVREPLLANLITGLTNGTDPAHEEYWGDITDFDQRMVECESIAFALLASPRHLLWERLSKQTQEHIAQWLFQLNGKQLPKVNWLWFRVFTNLVLVRLCGKESPEVQAQVNDDLDELDSFYLMDGWSSDGKWRPRDLDDIEWDLLKDTGEVHSLKPDRTADYYSGSFAIQFAQLLFVRFAGDLFPERAAIYCQRAREFGTQIWRYFDHEGSAIPFGRSLIYRFACGAFFAALAVARVPDMPPPLSSPGAIRGFLLRHLRWWARNSHDIFRSDGTLNLGFKYPNMYLTEDYNSPQSVYWALKIFVALGLPAQDPFWMDPERPYPEAASFPPVILFRAPRQIICQRPESHHFLLSAAQFTSLKWKAGPAKYSKFAYSSAFGFSVPTGQDSLQQLAPDNALVLSRDGTQTWATKWKCNEPTLGCCQVVSQNLEELPVATVVWYPWADRSVSVTTTLIPPSKRWPDWHVRLHRVRVDCDAVKALHLAEGGFAIQGRRRGTGLPLPAVDQTELDDASIIGHFDGVVQNSDGVLVLSDSGASGMVMNENIHEGSSGQILAFQPEANTNIMAPRTLIPLSQQYVRRLKQGDTLLLVSKVFAIVSQASQAAPEQKLLQARWLDRPMIRYGQSSGLETSDHILVSLGS